MAALCALGLALGFSGCSETFCTGTPNDRLGALLQALLCWGASVPDEQPPVASIELDKDLIDSGETVRLDASRSRDADGPIERYEWNVDGEAGYEVDTRERAISQVLTYRESPADEYRAINLRITDDEGSTATATTGITIRKPNPLPRPTAAFRATPNPVAIDQRVTFDASGSTAASKYEWDNDGNGTFEREPSTSPTFARTYQGPPRTVPVTLRVRGERGATDTETVPITVFATQAAAAVRRRTFAARFTRIRFPSDLGTPRRRGSLAIYSRVHARGRLVAPANALGALSRFRRASWVARLRLSADTRTGVTHVRAYAVARFGHGAGRACMRITAMRRSLGAPHGRLVLLGGRGRASRLHGGGSFHFRFRGTTPRAQGQPRTSLGRARPFPPRCAGL